MHLAPTERQQRLRAELRTYFARLMPDGPPLGAGPDEQRALLRRIGADGLLGLGWPVEYGGQGRGADEQFVFFDEAYRAGAPVSMVTLNTVGPTLMKYGTAEQKAYFLPRILSGDLVFAIGYSEPEAGTDLASLRTRAVTGRGILGGRRAEDLHLQRAERRLDLARLPHRPRRAQAQRDLDHPGADRRTRLLVDPDRDGRRPDHHGDVLRRHPGAAGNLVGEENAGWGLITNQLNHERVALAAIGMQAEDFYDAALAYACTPDPVTSRRPVDHEWVKAKVAATHARLAVNRLLSWRLVGDVGAGISRPETPAA